MQVRDLINTCKAAMPVVIGMTDYNRHGAPCYTTARYRSPSFITGPILSAYVQEWYISDGHIMIGASTIRGGNHGKIISVSRNKRIQVQDLAWICGSVNTVSIEYVQGPVNRSAVYRSLAAVDGSDATAEVLRLYFKNNVIILEVRPYGKE